MIPTSTKVSVQLKSKLPREAQAVAVFVAEKGRVSGDAPQILGEQHMLSIQRLIRADAMRGKAREVAFDLIDAARGELKRLYAVGLGSVEKITPETVRQAAGALARAVRKHRIRHVAVVPPVLRKPGRSGSESTVTGYLLSAFDFDEYRGAGRKKERDESNGAPVTLTILSTEHALAHLKPKVERGRIIADSQNFARTIASRPGNDINPPRLAQVAQSLAKESRLACRILDEKQMKKLGMGGILAVGGGSTQTPPRMIVLEYRAGGAKKKAKPLLVVGKAITFDSGGISIKPADKMGRMIYDKCGGMAVLGLMAAVARLKPKIDVIGILTSAENILSDRSYRPGDILRMYNGVTVEVTNTDAEGRLVLGDALAWGIDTYKPQAVVDLATLTGGCVVALGTWQAGMMGTNDELASQIMRASESSGEKFWRLPLSDDERDQIKSESADIVNSAGRWGSAITAGAFLSYFVPSDGSVPWVHLDIAGVADTEKDWPYYGKGATGFGVRTLVEWVTARAET